MRHGKKPTRAQKIKIRRAGLDPADWLVISAAVGHLHLVHRYGNADRILYTEEEQK